MSPSIILVVGGACYGQLAWPTRGHAQIKSLHRQADGEGRVWRQGICSVLLCWRSGRWPRWRRVVLLMSTILPSCGFLVNQFCIQFLDIKQQEGARKWAFSGASQRGNGAEAWRRRRRPEWRMCDALPAFGASRQAIVDNITALGRCGNGKAALNVWRTEGGAASAEGGSGRIRPDLVGTAGYCGRHACPAAAKCGGRAQGQ